MTAAENLRDRGVVVIEATWVSQHLATLQQKFDDALRSFPEFRDGVVDLVAESRLVLGGFGALGNPSSFHHPLFRRLREWIMSELLERVFQEYAQICGLGAGNNWGFHTIVDRVMYRAAGCAPSKESWHRDEAPSALEGDHTFGGWVNLDNEDQFFSCIPGSHAVAPGGAGFGLVGQNVVNGVLAEGHVHERVRVPPGAVIIFFEHIVHEVYPKRLSYNSRRLFLGWRFTQSAEPLHDLTDYFENQAVPLIKSDQRPQVWANAHWMWTRNRHKLVNWSQRVFKPECLEMKAIKSRPHEVHQVVHRWMRSLAEYGLPMYSAYSEREKSIYYPNAHWQFLRRGQANQDDTVLYHLNNV